MASLLDRARAWRRQRTLVLLREGGVRLLCWSLPALTVALWLDEVFLLPQAARAACWLAGCCGLLAGAYCLLLRPWRRNCWGVVLDEVAREFPQLRAFLRPAWELREAAPGHTSAQLAQAHLEATERLLEALPERPAFRWRPPRRLCRAAALAGMLTWPWLGASSWERVLAPWRDVPLERFLTVRPGDAVWGLGQPATISVRPAGLAGGPRQAAETMLWLRTSGPWRSVPWERRLPDGAAFTVASIAEPLQYRVTWRGLESRAYRLNPEPVPQLESPRARLAGQAAAVALNGSEPLAARRGTWIVVSGRPNQPLARAALRASFLPAPMALRCANGDCQAGFLAQQDGTFQFDLETPDGRRDPSPVVYALTAVPDEPPRVELLSPLHPVQASATGVLPVAYSVRDDSGLSRVTLLVRIPGEAEKEVLLQRFLRNAPKEFIGDHPWELAGLPVGARVGFRVKAYDDAAPPQSAVSEPGVAEIVDFEAGHRAAQQRWRKAEELLGRLAGREERLRDLYAAADAAGALGQLSGLPEAWKESVAAMTDLSQAMQADAYANPGLSEQFSGLAADLRRAESRDLPAALAAARQGDAASARGRHGRLAEQLRRAQRLLQNGRPVQELQDFYLQAGRMSQDGEQIASALEAMSGFRKGQAPGEALQRIQTALQRLQERMSALQSAIAALPQAAPGGAEDKSRRTYAMPLLAAQTSADALQAALRAGDFAMAADIAKELARQLAAIEAAVTAVASAGAASAPGRQGSARMERLQALWSRVVEEQTGLVETSQGLEEGRRDRFVAAQKNLLAQLAAEETVLISSAAAWGADFSGAALPVMKALRDEFASGRVSRAPDLARIAAASLRAAAGKGPPALSGRPSPFPEGAAAQSTPQTSGRAEALGWFAAAQEAIGRRLAEAPAAPPPQAPNPETAAASRRQAEVRGRTAELQRELEAMAAEFAAAPPEAAQNMESAQGEQQSAEAELDRGDSSAALAHQQKALALLEQGGEDLERCAAGQKRVEIGIGAGFSQPATGVRAAPGGGAGARLEFVPLPTAKDYQPPKEIREELERSLKESRPAAYDSLIKEYFKRISQ